MGQKTNPKGLRLGIVSDWDCTWYGDKDYGKLVYEDFNIRNYITSALQRAGVSRVKIERKAKLTEAKVYVARAGIIFGKKGLDLSAIRDDLEKKIGKKIKITVIDEKNPDANAKLLGEWIAGQLERRIPFRRAMKMAIQKALKAGAEGIKVGCAGRLGGVEIARSEWYREGRVPLHTLRADIDYAFSEALTTYGKIGVKVWIYNGEVLTKQEQRVEEEAAVESAELG